MIQGRTCRGLGIAVLAALLLAPLAAADETGPEAVAARIEERRRSRGKTERIRTARRLEATVLYGEYMSLRIARATRSRSAEATAKVEKIVATAEAWMALCGHARAQPYYEEALQRAPSALDLKLRLAHCLGLQGKSKAALPLYGRIAAEAPLAATAHFGTGWSLLEEGKTSQAVREFRKAFEAEPKSVVPLVLAGYARARVARYAQARDLFEEALKKDGKCAQAAYLMGLDYDVEEEHQAAMKALKRAKRLAPQFPEYAATLSFAEGNAYFATGSYRPAEKSFEKAVKVEPKNLYGYTCLAASQRRAKRYAHAIKTYRSAIELAPDDADLRLLVGQIFDVHLKDADRAITEYEAYRNAGGEIQAVTAWITRLRK